MSTDNTYFAPRRAEGGGMGFKRGHGRRGYRDEAQNSVIGHMRPQVFVVHLHTLILDVVVTGNAT